MHNSHYYNHFNIIIISFFAVIYDLDVRFTLNLSNRSHVFWNEGISFSVVKSIKNNKVLKSRWVSSIFICSCFLTEMFSNSFEVWVSFFCVHEMHLSFFARIHRKDWKQHFFELMLVISTALLNKYPHINNLSIAVKFLICFYIAV